ncbi:hypothetical protein [Acinetobacter rudis]|uniref:hypothetical protein n=1 Tax=Acinetobacter rudis TaxID=632955 RepID=UPI00333ED9FC
MKLKQCVLILGMSSITGLFIGCDSKNSHEQPVTAQNNEQQFAEVLPYLDVQQRPLLEGLPACEKKNCVDFTIQTLHTQDVWLNDWITQQLARVISQQIGQSHPASLTQALADYAEKSRDWQKEFEHNQAFQLTIQSKIAAQRNQYVLLQVAVDSQQGDTRITQRQYFNVADRKLKRSIGLAEIVQEQQVQQLDAWVQKEYQTWLKKQNKVARASSEKRLDWQSADWFFDQEGIGLHYRMNQIAMDATALNIYLSKAQTQQILKADIFQAMF